MAAKKRKKAKKKLEPPKLIEEDNYTVVMSREELLSSIQVLSFAKGMFEQLAVNSKKDGDDDAMATWVARAKLSLLLCSKFREVINIGEPTSREVH
jgi:hypothetical protein